MAYLDEAGLLAHASLGIEIPWPVFIDPPPGCPTSREALLYWLGFRHGRATFDPLPPAVGEELLPLWPTR